MTALATATVISATPSASSLDTQPGRLSPRERATAEALAKFDASLAGLFALGVSLLPGLEKPGVPHLVAHVGREVANGVERILSGAAPEMCAAGREDDFAENESNRERIAVVLGVPPRHGLVTGWLGVKRAFAASAHYGSKPTPGQVQDAFSRFSDLLYGLLGPYFSTHIELSELAKVARPSPDEAKRAGQLLLRRQQRWHFFAKLEESGWLRPLDEAGLFRSPPPRNIQSDGSWRLEGWPEGRYLARVASVEPEHVAEILLALPKDNDNPAVWSCVIEAAMAMPASVAKRLVPAVIGALKSATGDMIAHDAIGLTTWLAQCGEAVAVKLAGELLWLAEMPREAAAGTGNEPAVGRLRGTKWLIPKLDVHELAEFLDRAVPALQALDPVATIRLLAGKLRRAVALVDSVRGDGAKYEGSTAAWCERLGSAVDSSDPREMLAVALARVSMSEAGSGPRQAVRVWGLLECDQEIFERVRWMVLVSAGLHLEAQLNALIGGDRLLDPPFLAGEAAVLLRTQFSNASPQSKSLFRHSLERGPDAAYIARMVELQRERRGEQAEEERPDSVIGRIVSEWQAKRLRWFHDRIPSELRGLADRIGVAPGVPTEERQSLDEVGGYVGPAMTGAADASPLEAEAMATMSAEGIVGFLSEWNGPGESWDGAPSRSGLERALGTFAEKDPSKGLQVARRGMERGIAAGYLAAVLSSLRQAVETSELQWDEVLAVATRAVAEASSDRRQPPDEMTRWREPWRAVLEGALELVRVPCTKNRLPLRLSNAAWELVSTAVRSETSWATSAGDASRTLSDVANAALNSMSGSATRTLLEVALWNYRAAGDSSDPPLPTVESRSAIPSRLGALLDEVVRHEGKAGQCAQAILGHYLPQVYLLAPEWMASHEEELIGRGIREPMERPAWALYLLRAPFSDDLFARLRRWYALAAEAGVQGLPKAADEVRWTPLKGLAEHVLVAAVRGCARLGDADRLVENTFGAVSGEAKASVFFDLHGAWSDSPETVPPEFVQRMLAFWEWRLGELEAAPSPEAAGKEADGLLQFISLPQVPPAEAIRLGRRTARLASADQHSRGVVWGRLGELARADPVATFDLLEQLIERELSAPYAYLRLGPVEGAFRAALGCADSGTRERAESLVHRLGERGFEEFGALLEPADGSAPA